MLRLLLALLALPSLAVAAQTAAAVSPHLPEDGAVTGGRPLFQIAYSGIADADLRQVRFRITLSDDGFRSESHVFDQRQHAAGWSPGEDGQVVYRPRKSIEDGVYEWKSWLWNGTAWVGGPESNSLRIDTIPPAPVTGLRLEYSEERSTIWLSWNPVATDLEGGAEYVSRYHIYRYRGSPPFPLTAAYEIAVTDRLATEVESDLPSAEDNLFYRVTAEDEAGNETGRRR